MKNSTEGEKSSDFSSSAHRCFSFFLTLDFSGSVRRPVSIFPLGSFSNALDTHRKVKLAEIIVLGEEYYVPRKISFQHPPPTLN